MGSAAELRRQVESALAERIPAALSFRPPVAPELLPCGVAEVDAVLGGGLPRGAITEMTGAPSCGRTTLALTTLAEVTRLGESCAYVDASDALNPISAAALGVDLRRLLWVRTKPNAHGHPVPQRPRNIYMRRETSWTRLDHALRATDLLLCTGGFRALVLDLGDVSPEQARRVPMATWYRFRLQVEKSRTLFLLITRVPCANSCAAVSLHCQLGAIPWQPAAVDSRIHTPAPNSDYSPLHNSVHYSETSPLLLTGLHYRLSVARSRTVDPTRKKSAPSAEAAWNSTTPWSR